MAKCMNNSTKEDKNTRLSDTIVIKKSLKFVMITKMGVTGLENKIANFVPYHSHLWEKKKNKNNNEECIILHWNVLRLA